MYIKDNDAIDFSLHNDYIWNPAYLSANQITSYNFTGQSHYFWGSIQILREDIGYTLTLTSANHMAAFIFFERVYMICNKGTIGIG